MLPSFRSLITLIILLFSAYSGYAEQKTFVRTYTYSASEADSKLSARTIAMAQVKQLLLEEIGSYVYSNIVMKTHDDGENFSEITNAQVKSVTASISRTKLIEETWNGEEYFLKAEITIDEEFLKKRLEEVMKNEEELNRIEVLQRRSDSAFREIEELKRRLLLARTEQERKDLQERYDQAAGEFQILNNDKPRIEVVFVLDATGSMGGMIANAKDKIYAIATTMAQTEPAPELSMGVIAFRDKSDSYITKQLPLTDNLDDLYSQLLDINAGGGGDHPESVNQALAEAVFDYQWDPRPSTLRMIYLIGDAPPHMNYPNDIKYPVSCQEAKKKDIIINTIQCGTTGQTRSIWQNIAQNANGEYLSLNQAGNNFAVTTPFDDDIARKAAELDDTRVYYGAEADAMAEERIEEVSKISAVSGSREKARRGVYNATTSAGHKSFIGEGELVDKYENGEIKVEDIDATELPSHMKSMVHERKR